jgi:hypothetical protein
MPEISKIHIDDKNKGMFPVMMFIIYGGSHNFIEVADIDKNLNVTSSKPMSISTLKKFNKYVTENFIKQKQFKFDPEILPDNLIYFDGSESIIWYEKPSKRTLYFNNDCSCEYNLPLTVFKLKNEKLSIFVSDTKKIKNDMKLYPNIFPNTYSEGEICMGNNKPGDYQYISEVIKYYTSFFYNAKFTGNLSSSVEKYFDRSIKEGKFPKDFFKGRDNYFLLKEIL